MFRNWFGSPNYPDFWKRYEAGFQQVSGKQVLREIPFAVIDTETTGLNPSRDALLSIAGVMVINSTIEVATSFEIRLKQEKKPQQQDIAIHGILPADHGNLFSLEDALDNFLKWLGSAVLVGHHVNFDLAVLNKGLEQCGCPKLRNLSVDTATLATRVLGMQYLRDTSKWSLDALADKFSIPLHDRHTAAGDAYITGILLLKLLNRLEGRAILTLDDLLQSPGEGILKCLR